MKSCCKLFFLTMLLMGAVLLLASCATPPTPIVQTQAVTKEVPVTVQVEVTRVVEVTPAVKVPFEELWAKSAHADKTAEAFKHWDNATPVEIPADCARCHSAPGYREYLAAGKVANPVAIGTVIECQACHDEAASNMTSVTFPSGATIENLGPEARCMTCHQGRASKKDVDDSIAKAGLTDPDTISQYLGFTDFHYFAAAATLYGAEANGGYEYDGKTYDPKFQHVSGYNTCVGCHNPHTLEVKVDECKVCHTNVGTQDDLQNIRMNGSLEDYNGNGDAKEGVAAEIDGLRRLLLQAMQAYAGEVSQTPIAYDPATYPYFFKDTNANGQAEADEVEFGNKYDAWTGRLAKAAYNYQVSVKDPGAFAHNAKYIVELLYDSIEDLNGKLSQPVEMGTLHRDDAAHFAGNTEPFRHWDAEGEVPFACAKCHSATGLPEFLNSGGSLVLTTSGALTVAGIGNQPIANGFMCTTCHDPANFPERRAVTTVPFPSGASLTFSTEKDDQGNLKPVDSNLCLECHQGRESTNSVNAVTRSIQDDEIKLRADGKTNVLGFRNIHYFAAGATLFGDLAKGMYQYADQKYNGQFTHGGLGPTQCAECHNVHALTVQVDVCAACHKTVKTVEDLATVRGPNSTADYDGDGNVTEGMKGEVDGMRDALYAAIQAYAKDKAGMGITYHAAAYPYFFQDQDGDGKPDKNDQGANISYPNWTPRLLKAAYNYQASVKDPGQFAHNGQYVLQVLYDSLKDLGGDVKGMTRP